MDIDSKVNERLYKQLLTLESLKEKLPPEFIKLHKHFSSLLKLHRFASDDLFLILDDYKTLAVAHGASGCDGDSEVSSVAADEGTAVSQAIKDFHTNGKLSKLLDIMCRHHILDLSVSDEIGQANDVASYILAAWELPYVGTMHQSLLRNITVDKRTSPYSSSGVILQSSGYGKSRGIDEMSKLIFTIPGNARSPSDSRQGAYPPPDTIFGTLITIWASETFDECVTSIHLFLAILFETTLEQCQILGISQDGDPCEVAVVWRNHLLEKLPPTGTTVRSNLYERVYALFSMEVNQIQARAFAEKRATKAISTLLRALPDGRPPGLRKDTDELKAVMYIDEAHTMVIPTKTPQTTVYDAFTKALVSFSSLPLFTLFISTGSLVAGPTPSSHLALSLRHAHYARRKFNLFGRSLFWTLAKVTSPENALDIAKLKLIFSHNPRILTMEGKAAILDVLLNLHYHPHWQDTQQLMHTQVASHMRTVFSVPNSRAYLHSGYPSEPILAHAALDVVQGLGGPDNLIKMFSELNTGCDGAVDLGQRGEHIGKILLLQAYMSAVHSDHVDHAGKVPWQNGCKLTTFLDKLIEADAIEGTMVGEILPDNIAAGKKLSEAFKDARVRFTHFVQASDDAAMSSSMAWIAFIRGTGIIARRTSLESFILLQMKNRSKAGSITAYTIDESKMEIFPPRHSPRYTALKPTDADEEKAWLARPYITIIMELGTVPSIGLPAAPLSQKRTDQGNEPPLRGNKVSKKHAVVLVPAASSKLSQPSSHPRYTLFVYGCSPQVYNSVTPANRSIYEKLLQVQDPFSEHPRRQTIEHVKNMKPYWGVGASCFSWINDAFMSGKIPPAKTTAASDDGVALYSQMHVVEVSDDEEDASDLCVTHTEAIACNVVIGGGAGWDHGTS
ncbi:hypothetical protein ONZ45_g13639 [Pleurotus djamor]|nr:hypothetical protein ONZ45_g13639 [Pleurotus djamor]